MARPDCEVLLADSQVRLEFTQEMLESSRLEARVVAAERDRLRSELERVTRELADAKAEGEKVAEAAADWEAEFDRRFRQSSLGMLNFERAADIKSFIRTHVLPSRAGGDERELVERCAIQVVTNWPVLSGVDQIQADAFDGLPEPMKEACRKIARAVLTEAGVLGKS
jgi:hypothetical protein